MVKGTLTKMTPLEATISYEGSTKAVGDRGMAKLEVVETSSTNDSFDDDKYAIEETTSGVIEYATYGMEAIIERKRTSESEDEMIMDDEIAFNDKPCTEYESRYESEDYEDCRDDTVKEEISRDEENRLGRFISESREDCRFDTGAEQMFRDNENLMDSSYIESKDYGDDAVAEEVSRGEDNRVELNFSESGEDCDDAVAEEAIRDEDKQIHTSCIEAKNCENDTVTKEVSKDEGNRMKPSHDESREDCSDDTGVEQVFRDEGNLMDSSYIESKDCGDEMMTEDMFIESKDCGDETMTEEMLRYGGNQMTSSYNESREDCRDEVSAEDGDIRFEPSDEDSNASYKGPPRSLICGAFSYDSADLAAIKCNASDDSLVLFEKQLLSSQGTSSQTIMLENVPWDEASASASQRKAMCSPMSLLREDDEYVNDEASESAPQREAMCSPKSLLYETFQVGPDAANVSGNANALVVKTSSDEASESAPQSEAMCSPKALLYQAFQVGTDSANVSDNMPPTLQIAPSDEDNVVILTTDAISNGVSADALPSDQDRPALVAPSTWNPIEMYSNSNLDSKGSPWSPRSLMCGAVLSDKAGGGLIDARELNELVLSVDDNKTESMDHNSSIKGDTVLSDEIISILKQHRGLRRKVEEMKMPISTGVKLQQETLTNTLHDTRQTTPLVEVPLDEEFWKPKEKMPSEQQDELQRQEVVVMKKVFEKKEDFAAGEERGRDISSDAVLEAMSDLLFLDSPKPSQRGKSTPKIDAPRKLTGNETNREMVVFKTLNQRLGSTYGHFSSQEFSRKSDVEEVIRDLCFVGRPRKLVRREGSLFHETTVQKCNKSGVDGEKKKADASVDSFSHMADNAVTEEVTAFAIVGDNANDIPFDENVQELVNVNAFITNDLIDVSGNVSNVPVSKDVSEMHPVHAAQMGRFPTNKNQKIPIVWCVAS